MEMHFSPTTPLFLEDETDNCRISTTISPTQELSLPTNEINQLPFDERQHIYPDRQMFASSNDNITSESFVTARTRFNNDASNNSSQRHIFSSLAHSNNNSNVTLAKQNTIIEHPDDNMTPLAPNTETFINTEDNSHQVLQHTVNNRLDATGLNQLEGLGLSMGSPEHSTEGNRDNFSQTSGIPDSPRKAIRASMLLTSKASNRNSVAPSQLPPALEQLNTNNETDRSTYTNGTDANDTFNFEDTVNESLINDTVNTSKFDDTIDSIDSSSNWETSSIRHNSVEMSDGKIDTTSSGYDSKTLPNYAYLFIVAAHSFDATTLDNKDDIRICLSFDEDDVGFVHNVDASGWGEVTLIPSQRRGWVPLNYFADYVKKIPDADDYTNSFKYLRDYVNSKAPMEDLLTDSAKFLINISDNSTRNTTVIHIDLINAIRDGVKKLLELTGCVSRSDEIVQAKENVRKSRKKLLADWYSLMIKADHYKDTQSLKNLLTLNSLVYEVLRRAFTFYKVWSTEKLSFERSKTIKRDDTASQTKNRASLDKGCEHLSNKDWKHNSTKFLTSVPQPTLRLNEVYHVLSNYLSLIMGRLDMIEDNPAGCEALEFMVHQIIILLRELLYISKTCSYIIKEKYQYAYEDTLDKNLDPLLSLVSELVSATKVVVTTTLHDNLYDSNPRNEGKHSSTGDSNYTYSENGQTLLKIAAKMITLIGHIVTGCNSYMRLIGDFELDPERKYPDFMASKLSPEAFIAKCSTTNPAFNVKQSQINTPTFETAQKRFNASHQVNSLKNGAITLAPLDGETDSKVFSRESTFDKYRIDENDKLGNFPETVFDEDSFHKECMFDKEGALIGASFKALVYKLTDELEGPSELLVFCFLLNFRKFGNSIDLVSELLSRFDVTGNSLKYERTRKNASYSSKERRLKNRRKLVCSTFQRWMESFWVLKDYGVLPTIINFCNECVSSLLPIQSKVLTEIASQLVLTCPQTFDPQQHQWRDVQTTQLIVPVISNPKTISVLSEASSTNSLRLSVFSLNDRVIDDYDLAAMPDTKRDSVHLPLPMLNLGTSTLLSKNDAKCIDNLNEIYRTLYKVSNTPEPRSEQSLLNIWKDLNHSDITGNYLVERYPRSRVSLALFSPLEIAKQLVLLESELYLRIQPFELINYKNPEKCSNITAVLEFTNQLSNYVIDSLVATDISLGQRVERLMGWLRIALASVYFRNFNSVAAIMTSLQSHTITRIAMLWDQLEKKDMKLFEYLSRIIHPNHNYKVYRTKLNMIIGDNQYPKSPLPVVPFFNLFVQDLTFLNDGNSDYRNPDVFRPNKLVNIDKFLRITRVIGHIQYFQVGYERSSQGDMNADDSFFRMTEQLSIDTTNITALPTMQEFILYEFQRISKIYKESPDRGYELSFKIAPR
ncbi:Ras family guanine nucleotide exchange factor BUD5 KNAG_0C00810 [Huiozyma naganishii CBS 8797]|uniref:Ras-GEF domain-containing protein n=1 Tax=Huiozyma naganishii (strain ATCC MYA-139 / BCRC 22969 / CBS 8797 / KCTC 17520 / NBRC 10181 / NCYC 3082 / Yp74L-3) TaxID=1071383 RepID=J7R2Y6_HUIN7|nr:hypothetical protein KNAG_0C00810 [Kazachstania naganishii CBS 8797]CCK69195.1 hypothetical protein KNAG_0C00810 [Kazachstania naganishii CBS 8797]